MLDAGNAAHPARTRQARVGQQRSAASIDPAAGRTLPGAAGWGRALRIDAGYRRLQCQGGQETGS